MSIRSPSGLWHVGCCLAPDQPVNLEEPTVNTVGVWRRLAAALAVVLLLSVAPAALAQVKPGDFITKDNASKVKDLVSPGVYYKVAHGMSMNIIPTGRIDWPPPYKEATEKYSAQCRLSPDHRTLEGYVAGQPFPMIDSNDPYVAEKIMWNNCYRPELGDDYDLRAYDAKLVYENDPRVITYYLEGHYAGYNLTGRTEVEPLPTDPDFKTTGRLWLFGMYPILAPATSRGSGIIRYRYADPARADDSWDWTPGTRRVRRLDETILSDAAGVTTWDPDTYGGFGAKNEEYDYRFLGEKNLLGCLHAKFPLTECKTDGDASACPEDWEIRHMYVVEATLRHGWVANADLHGKYIVYEDSEEWWSPYIDLYDHQGVLWYVHIWWNTYRDRPNPNSRIAIYPFKRAFSYAHGSTDVQSGLAGMAYLPPLEGAETESWYINMGAVDRQFFTVQAMQKVAP